MSNNITKTEAYKIIENLTSKIKELTKKYETMDSEITRLFVSGYSKKSPHILTLESLKLACREEINTLRNQSVKVKEDAWIIR